MGGTLRFGLLRCRLGMGIGPPVRKHDCGGDRGVPLLRHSHGMSLDLCKHGAENIGRAEERCRGRRNLHHRGLGKHGEGVRRRRDDWMFELLDQITKNLVHGELGPVRSIAPQEGGNGLIRLGGIQEGLDIHRLPLSGGIGGRPFGQHQHRQLGLPLPQRAGQRIPRTAKGGGVEQNQIRNQCGLRVGLDFLRLDPTHHPAISLHGGYQPGSPEGLAVHDQKQGAGHVAPGTREPPG